MSRLGDIRERVEAATPGPWHSGGDGAICSDHVEPNVCWPIASCSTSRTNAAFIAHARQDIPALLAVAEAAARLSECYAAEAPSSFDTFVGLTSALRDALAALEAAP